MRRRELVTLVSGAAMWPFAARAQQVAKIPRIGILSPASSVDAPMMRVLRGSFRDLGYVEGLTISLQFAFAER